MGFGSCFRGFACLVGYIDTRKGGERGNVFIGLKL